MGRLPELALVSRPERWGRVFGALLALIFLAGLWARLADLSAEGFADDEIHKWLAAGHYLQGDFGGDDVEHPMLMKLLVTLCLVVGRPLGWAPETITRLPCAVAGAFSVLAIAWLGRRLFGRIAGLVSAGVLAASTTFIGYNRVAKEDSLVALFLLLALWCTAEAKAAADDGRARDQGRWELATAVTAALLCASKYFGFLGLLPLVVYAWLRSTGTSWRLPGRRWAVLFGVAFVVFALFNWTPFLPSTWVYAQHYLKGGQTIHGGLYFAGRVYRASEIIDLAGVPPWFFAAFAWVKLAPPTVLAALGGLVLALWQRAPAHRVVLAWIGVWVVWLCTLGGKFGRFFESLEPALVLLAGYLVASVAAWMGERTARWAPAAAGVLGLLLVGTEARAAVAHAPHYRLYISALGGGDARVTYWFPHCDYFDAGLREAMQAIARGAEPGAVVSTEVDWPASYYASAFGRPDLKVTLFRPGQACPGDRPCYVVAQAGRWYFHNLEPLARLDTQAPWHVERIRGVDVVKVYRLPSGVDPFVPGR
jgi:4-amino-4-deoxy-L-arabinose transferase-like glycosyltransferase